MKKIILCTLLSTLAVGISFINAMDMDDFLPALVAADECLAQNGIPECLRGKILYETYGLERQRRITVNAENAAAARLAFYFTQLKGAQEGQDALTNPLATGLPQELRYKIFHYTQQY